MTSMGASAFSVQEGAEAGMTATWHGTSGKLSKPSPSMVAWPEARNRICTLAGFAERETCGECGV